MLTSLTDIISGIRRDTLNADDVPTSTNAVGVETKDFVRHANYAQQMLQSRISKVVRSAFLAVAEIDIVADQAEYTIPDNVFLGTRIFSVRYSRTGDTADYLRLEPRNPYDTYSGGGAPTSYFRRNGKVVLQPIPAEASGSIEVVYERTLDRMDIRRGRVNGTPSGTTIDLTHSSFGSPDSEAETLLAIPGTYVCVSDVDGNVMLRNAVISSYNSGTDAITTAASVSTYLVGSYTLSSLADGYLTIGKYTSTHSGLDDVCEPFITSYVAEKIFKREASGIVVDETEDRKEMLQDIISAYKQADKDVYRIPILDYEWLDMSFDGWDG